MSDQDEPSDELADEEVLFSSPGDAQAPSHGRCIIHIDIDCFYAQVEMLERPELRQVPVGIQQKNIVVTSNYIARDRGVTKCCYVTEALEKCPDLVLVNGSDLARYRRMSARIHRVLTRFSRRVERLGFDENFLDVTEEVSERLGSGIARDMSDDSTCHVYGETGVPCTCGCEGRLAVGSAVAADIRRTLHQELGITSCAGVGFNKLLAKLVCATHKPNQQTVLLASGVDRLLLGAGPARALPGLGSRTAQSLSDAGIKTVQDIRRASERELSRVLDGNPAAATVRALAHGADEAEVKTTCAALSIGVEDGFKRVDNLEECEVKIRELIRRVLVLLQEDGRTPTVLKVSLRRYNKDSYYRFRESRQSKVMPSLFTRCMAHPEELEPVERVFSEAMILLKKMLNEPLFHLTLLGVAVTGFTDTNGASQKGLGKFLKKVLPSSHTAEGRDCTDTTKCTAAPAGVDGGVWAGLPPDIQAELLDHDFGPNRKRRQKTIASFFSATEPDGKTQSLPALDSNPRRQEASCNAEQLESDSDDPGSPVVSRTSNRGLVLGQLMPHSVQDNRNASLSRLQSPRQAAATNKGNEPTTDRFDHFSDIVNDVSQLESAVPHQPSDSASVQITAVENSFSAAERTNTSSKDETSCETNSHGDESHKIYAAAATLSNDNETVQLSNLASCAASAVGSPSAACATVESSGSSVPPAESWDADVFSHLPPDIQFELKLARRSQPRSPSEMKRPEIEQKRGQKTGRNSKRPLSHTSGNILKFFKK